MATEYEQAREMLMKMSPEDQTKWLQKHTHSSVQHVSYDVNELVGTRNQATRVPVTPRALMIGHFIDKNGILYEIKAYQKQHVIAGEAVPGKFTHGFDSFLTFLGYAKEHGIDKVLKADREAIEMDTVITLERMLAISPRYVDRADNLTYVLSLEDFENLLATSKGFLEYGSLDWLQMMAIKNDVDTLPVIM